MLNIKIQTLILYKFQPSRNFPLRILRCVLTAKMQFYTSFTKTNIDDWPNLHVYTKKVFKKMVCSPN